MLLTLAMQSLNDLIDEGDHDIQDIPSLSSGQFDLRGVMIDAHHLSGWSLETYDIFRNNADKANAPCLLVRDNPPMDLSNGNHELSRERIQRLSVAANRLGCNAVAITPIFPEDDQALQFVTDQLREAMQGVEKLELNLLLQPTEGKSSDPDQHIDIIKQIGGFRIGALPTFSAASATGDGINALQKLAPYAGGIVADFPTGRGKKAIDLVDGLAAIQDVGYSNTISLNYIGKGNPMIEIRKAAKKMHAFLEKDH